MATRGDRDPELSGLVSIARCVSETVENVCIIDVKSLEQQASVMIERVQNHAVEILIVDEIGRKAEVDAAGTVRQRGPRLIASAQGLVGGVQSATMADAAAQKASGKGKVQAAGGGNPTFDVIVELDNVDRGKCRIIWNAGEAVASILASQGYTFETRLLDLHTLGIHEFPESSSRNDR